MAKFEKVSLEQFKKEFEYEDITNTTIEKMYNNISLPLRATKDSAGYDISSTEDFILEPDQSIIINTGLRCQIDEGWVLMICPRSGLGFKYRATLANTLGVIDGDYYNSDNEGHIKIKMCNNGDKYMCIKAGDKIAQGIFLPYGITTDDNVTNVRNGGFGSTDK